METKSFWYSGIVERFLYNFRFYVRWLSANTTRHHQLGFWRFAKIFQNPNVIIQKYELVTPGLSYRYASCSMRSTWAYQRQHTRSAAEGRCSCDGHRARTTRDVKSAVLQRPSRTPPTGPDRLRPTAHRVPRTSLPLVSSTAKYYNYNIIIIINIHHHCNNTGILYSCVVWIVCSV